MRFILPEDKNQNREAIQTDGHYMQGSPKHEYAPTVVPTKRKTALKLTKRSLFFGLGSLLFVATIAGASFYMLRSVMPHTTIEPTKAMTLEMLGGYLKSSLGERSNVSALVYKSNDPLSVINKVGDKAWVVSDRDVDILGFSSIREDNTKNTGDFEKIVTTLKTKGFTELKASTQSTLNYGDKLSFDRFFASDTFICNMHNRPDSVTGTGSGSLPVYLLSVDCTAKSGFDSAAKALAPLSEAYFKGVKNEDKDIVFGKPQINSSAVKDYKNVQLTIADLSNYRSKSAGLFYQTPDHNWHYLTITDNQNTVPCEVFSTDQIKSAFLGTPCWDKATAKSAFVHFPIRTPENDPNTDSK